MKYREFLTLAAFTSVTLIVVGTGCTKTKPSTASDTPTQPDPAVIREICRAECSGPYATITVYRDVSGHVGAIENDGDVQSCSHPPTRFFDPRGKEIGVIPLKPVVPDSAEARRLQAIRDKATKGLKKTESFTCKSLTAGELSP